MSLRRRPRSPIPPSGQSRGAVSFPIKASQLRPPKANRFEKTVGRHWSEIGSNNDKAAYAEFGTAKVPPRPFFGPAAAEGAGAMVLRSQQRVARAFWRTRSRPRPQRLSAQPDHAKHAIKDIIELAKIMVE